MTPLICRGRIEDFSHSVSYKGVELAGLGFDPREDRGTVAPVGRAGNRRSEFLTHNRGDANGYHGTLKFQSRHRQLADGSHTGFGEDERRFKVVDSILDSKVDAGTKRSLGCIAKNVQLVTMRLSIASSVASLNPQG